MSVKNLIAGALALAVTGSAAPADLMTSSNPDGFMNMVYYTDWYVAPPNVPHNRVYFFTITHINYAFLNLFDNGTVYPGDVWADFQKPFDGDVGPALYFDEDGVLQTKAYGCIGQLYKLKQENRRIKTFLSIGGWTWSSNFPAAASTEKGRAEFARSSVKLMRDWGFDGIDIDWEYPKTKTESENFVALLKRVRQELDDYAAVYTPSYHYSLAIAAPASPTHYSMLDLKSLGEILDYINLMSYDYGGSWSEVSGYLANLHPSEENTRATPLNTADVVDAYLKAGVPSHKLILGMPTYGRSFENTDGIAKSFTKPAEGKVVTPGVDGTWEVGAWDYKALPVAGAQEFDDEKAVAHYSYDEKKKQLITFDTPKIAEKKVDFLREKRLGGAMFWEASGDKQGDDSLISTSYKAQGGVFKASCGENQLYYPDSVFVNIAAAGKAALTASETSTVPSRSRA
ncbi:uncharacterized protein BROUX77_001869 [Berkeleyomyces rouxiae]|uniref:uncharacterized protein n=1 Tax=Berkeleyomyces rouxiae TaxID=2035830 RepID=UPI003B790724